MERYELEQMMDLARQYAKEGPGGLVWDEDGVLKSLEEVIEHQRDRIAQRIGARLLGDADL